MASNLWRRQVLTLLALFVCLMCSMIVYAEEFMPVSEVKTGMRGIAKTVVVGDTISTFDVEVLGVMKDRGPSGDLILARFSGPVMDEYGGIAHGMSGSPVYIDNKLVGAVAYGWGFADAKIGMITPIEDMVKLWNIPYEKYLPQPWQGEGDIVPLKTPLMAYGFDRESLAYMQQKLKHYNFTAYDTAAASGDEEVKPLTAGGSVAALLVNGDLKLGAIGTVTYVDKDHIVAFGHPYLKRGAMNYFMHNAHIFTVVKSLESSFKMGSMGAKVGNVHEDRGAGIAGIVGRSTPAIPVRINLLDKDKGDRRNVFVNIIEDEDLTPTLAATSVYSFLNKTLDRNGMGTSKLTLSILPRDSKYKPLRRTNMFYSSRAISEKSIDEMYDIIDALLNNSFVNYEIADIQVDVEVTKERETAKIIDASASPAIVSPGEDIYLKVKLHPFRSEDITKELIFHVPEDQPLGEMKLEVRGGGVVPLPYLIEKQKFNLTDEIIRRLRVYKNFDKFYDKILKMDTNNEIVVEILKTGVSMVEDDGAVQKITEKLHGVEKEPLPGELKKAKKVPNNDVPDDEDDEPTAKLVTDYVISGDGQLSIMVAAPEDKARLLQEFEKEHATKEAVATKPNPDEATKSDDTEADKDKHEGENEDSSAAPGNDSNKK